MPRWGLIVPLLLLSCSWAWADAHEKPNIVLILADDLGSGDLSCYNKDSKIATPNMDRLAAQGMRFTDAHSPSAVCSPTRYGILTGRYAWRGRLKRGVLWGYDPLLIEHGRLTLASMLKAAGYFTGCIGKWHLGLGENKKTDYTQPLRPGPNSVGFDYFFGIPASLDMDPYLFVKNEAPVEAPTKTIAASKHRRQGGEGFWRGGPIAPHFRHADVLPTLTQQAVQYLEQRAKEKQPFFLYLPLSAPHTPWLPAAEFRGKSKAGFYGDFVMQVDASVGQVLEALDRLKLADNTIVFLTSDNGSHWPEADIRRFQHRANLFFRGQKADIWEGGHRVPFIVRWPEHIPPGSTAKETICLTDIFATCAAVVGQHLPNHAAEDSYNLLPVLLGQKRAGPVRPDIVYHSVTGMFGIRQGDWVLIDGLGSGGFTAPQTEKPKPGGPRGQLYNLAADPRQQHNVYLEQPEIVARLQALLERQKKK